MAITWNDLSLFTWGEFDQLNLTWEDMEKLSTDELLSIAAKKLERFQSLPPETPISTDLSQKIDVLIAEVQELKDFAASQASPPLYKRILEGICSGLIANATTWAISHPREIHCAIIRVITIIDEILRQQITP